VVVWRRSEGAMATTTRRRRRERERERDPTDRRTHPAPPLIDRPEKPKRALLMMNLFFLLTHKKDSLKHMPARLERKRICAHKTSRRRAGRAKSDETARKKRALPLDPRRNPEKRRRKTLFTP
jgi:hypothetical protein